MCASASRTASTARAGRRRSPSPISSASGWPPDFDLYHQVNFNNPYALYENWTTGGTLRLGIPVTDDLTFQPNYSLYQSKISVPNTSSQPYDDCSGPNQPWIIGGTFYQLHSDAIR